MMKSGPTYFCLRIKISGNNVYILQCSKARVYIMQI